MCAMSLSVRDLAHKFVVWFIHPYHFLDRRIQACTVVVFCMSVILYDILFEHDASMAKERSGYAWQTIMVTVGVYHGAKTIDDFRKPKGET